MELLYSKIQPEIAKFAKKNITSATNEQIVQNATEKVTSKLQNQLKDLVNEETSRTNTLTTDSVNILNTEYLNISTKINNDDSNLYDKHVQHLKNETNTHITKINEVTDEKIQHINDVVTTAQTNIQNELATFSAQQPKHDEYFNVKVLYKDDITGQECNAAIVDIHEHDGETYYTVQFTTGKQRKIDAATLTRPPSSKAPVCQRFDKVDRSFLNATPLQTSSTVHNISNIVPPDSVAHIIKYVEPTPFDTRSFHTQFKTQLRSDDDIINFYLQLRSQGENYNIHLIDIKDVQPGLNLCPAGISAAARKKMSLSIFQKIQDKNTKDVTYIELKNIMDQLSPTSDEYEALKGLLRRVHPNLDDEHDEYERYTLSQCDYNLYTLSKQLRNYFNQEEINGRPYTPKEKSKIFLESLYDETYNDVCIQYLLDLKIATMHDKKTITKNTLKFNALPATIDKLNKKKRGTTVVRSMTGRSSSNSRYSNQSRGAYPPVRKNKIYEPIQCRGCGTWGHKVQKCVTIPSAIPKSVLWLSI